MHTNAPDTHRSEDGVLHGPPALSQPAILVAGDAEEAMAFLEQVTPDLILTDVMMPEVDGLTFVRRIRSGAVHGRIPIIIVSAGVTHREQAAAMQAGAAHFRPKPFSIA